MEMGATAVTLVDYGYNNNLFGKGSAYEVCASGAIICSIYNSI